MPNITKIKVDGELYDIGKVLESFPVGTIVNYDGDEVPPGWEKVDTPVISSEYDEENEELNLLNIEPGEFLNTYSTEEKRIGTWIDGKPLYRKVINFGLVGEDLIDKEYIVEGDFEKAPITNLFLEEPTSGATITLPTVYHRTDTYVDASVHTDPSTGRIVLVVRKGSLDDWSTWLLCGVICYTKTTDVVEEV